MKEMNGERRKKMTTSTTNEYEKHPYKEGLNGVVGKNVLSWDCGKHPKVMR